jgi:hypothetical protein
MTINSKVLAETLFTEFIQRRHCDVPEETHVEESAAPALEAKIRLYQYAIILLAILAEAEKRPQFTSVREHFERLYFPPSFDFDALSGVRAAMADLSTLLTLHETDGTGTSPAAGKAMFWARDWLARIGIEENNPVRLHLLALRWMDYYRTVVTSLKDFDPVA